MVKKIFITGSTDGIGLETARILVRKGNHVLVHGRNPEKLSKVTNELSKLGTVESYTADLSDLNAVRLLAKAITEKHNHLDVLINNAGVLKAPNTITVNNLDIRFAVNTIAPYLLTKKLLPLLSNHARIINVCSAAQSPVNLNALSGEIKQSDAMIAYSQSKLAIIMWSYSMGKSLGNNGPLIVSVNPGSLLGSKMVKEGFGIIGKDILIGADILVRASLEENFLDASSKYFDNDLGKFSSPYPDALDLHKCEKLTLTIEDIINSKISN